MNAGASLDSCSTEGDSADPCVGVDRQQQLGGTADGGDHDAGCCDAELSGGEIDRCFGRDGEDRQSSTDREGSAPSVGTCDYNHPPSWPAATVHAGKHATDDLTALRCDRVNLAPNTGRIDIGSGAGWWTHRAVSSLDKSVVTSRLLEQ